MESPILEYGAFLRAADSARLLARLWQLGDAAKRSARPRRFYAHAATVAAAAMWRPAIMARTARWLSTGMPATSTQVPSVEPPKTGVLLLNMGGPSDPSETGAFLKRLFTDSDIIDLGGGLMQELLGRFVSWRRTPRIAKQYEQIGGSPIGRWSNTQAEAARKLLDELHPDSAPHKVYVGFRCVAARGARGGWLTCENQKLRAPAHCGSAERH